MRGNGMNAWFGWPDAPKLEALRNQWLRVPDLATRKALARDIQLQAFQDVPCVPLGRTISRRRTGTIWWT